MRGDWETSKSKYIFSSNNIIMISWRYYTTNCIHFLGLAADTNHQYWVCPEMVHVMYPKINMLNEDMLISHWRIQKRWFDRGQTKAQIRCLFHSIPLEQGVSVVW